MGDMIKYLIGTIGVFLVFVLGVSFGVFVLDDYSDKKEMEEMELAKLEVRNADPTYRSLQKRIIKYENQQEPEKLVDFEKMYFACINNKNPENLEDCGKVSSSIEIFVLKLPEINKSEIDYYDRNLLVRGYMGDMSIGCYKGFREGENVNNYYCDGVVKYYKEREVDEETGLVLSNEEFYNERIEFVIDGESEVYYNYDEDRSYLIVNVIEKKFLECTDMMMC